MIKPATIKPSLIASIAPLFTPVLASANECNKDTPCIGQVTSATIRYYDGDLKETATVKKKAFNKQIPNGGLPTKGRKNIRGVSMIELAKTGDQGGKYVEETAFELDPEKTIDCDGIALATLGHDDDYTTGVSVGLGDACSEK